MQPDVLLFVEHVAREMDIACILRHLLATRYGMDVAVASIHFDLHATLCKFRPRVVVTPFFYFADDVNIQYLLQAVPGASYVNLAYEQLLSPGNMMFKRPRDPVVRRHVLHLASGPRFRDFLCNHGVEPANVPVIGSLPLALYRPPYRRQAEGHRHELAGRFGLDADRPWVFFPENFSAAFMRDKEAAARIARGANRDDTFAYRRSARHSFRTVMPWCWHVARQGVAEVIVRPRPATHRDELLRACQDVAGAVPERHLHCIKAGSVREWNLASDVVVSSYSSTLVEAAVAGKPAYLLGGDTFPASMRADWLEHAARLRSADQLLAVARDPARALSSGSRLARWAAENLAGDGDPMVTAAELIYRAGIGEGPVTAPPARAGSALAAAVHHARRRLRVLTAHRSRPHPRYEHDRFNTSTVLATTARWAAVLDAGARADSQVAARGVTRAVPPGRLTLTDRLGRADGAAVRPPPPVVPRLPVPLSVAFVVSARVWGGGESQVALLADGLRRRGHQCRFLARLGSLCAQRLRENGFAVDTFFGTGRDPISIWKIRQLLTRWQPDVLHLNDSHAITCGGLAARGIDIPVRVAARRSIFPLRSAHKYRRYADRVICVAEVVAEACCGAGVPAEAIRVVHDGTTIVDLPESVRRQVRRELDLNGHGPVLLTVAWLYAAKGHRFLLQALPAIVRRHPGTTLLLAGTGTEQEALQRQTEALGIADHVRFLGFRRDVPRLIRAADLLVMPTLSEGLCSSLIDAMLGGCPIVTTLVGGIGELVGADHLTADPVAWTVPPRDPEALAAAVLDAVRDPQVRAARAARAKQRALARFTTDRMVERTLAVYDELLPGRRPPAAASTACSTCL